MSTRKDQECAPHGRERLWLWFGLTRASWLTLPRSMMHEMPDDWQEKMAVLLEQWDETWDSSDMPAPAVVARAANKFTKWPEWLCNYRHPDRTAIKSLKRDGIEATP